MPTGEDESAAGADVLARRRGGGPLIERLMSVYPDNKRAKLRMSYLDQGVT